MAFDLSSIGTPVDVRYPLDLAEEAIASFEAARPGVVLRNASPEVVLIESMALACGAVVDAANQAVAVMAEILLADFYGVPRLPGAVAVGTLTVDFDSTVTTTIPAGTSFVLTDYGVEVASTADATVTAGLSLTVQVATVEATTLVNGVGPGAGVDVLDVIPNALTVAVASAFGGGADPEGQESYLVRARARLARVTNTLVVLEHWSKYCTEDGRASNALTIGAWDGVSLATAGDDGGHVSVVVYGHGAVLPVEVRDDLATAMQAITAAGIEVHVVDADVTDVDVTVTVAAMPGYSSDEVRAAVEAAAAEFLNPETWPIGDDVVAAQLSDRLTSLPSVDYVTTLDEPAADVVLAADGVPQAGTLTVSVT
jgi:uncharacterized phage protein gp47/JayE